MPEASGFWQRLDNRIFAVERALAVGVTAIMVVVVFLSVFWGLFAERAPSADASGFIRTYVPLLIWLLVCVFGVRTAKPTWAQGKQAGVGLAVGLSVLASGKAVAWLLPSGFVSSQKLALGLMMWMVFLGSSIAAHKRRHIMVQAAQKLIPKEQARHHASLSLLVASAFTAFLAVVSARYTFTNLVDWWQSARLAAMFEPSLGIPNWAITAAVPLGLGMTAARFFAHSIGIFRGIVPPEPPQEEVLQAASAVPAITVQDQGQGTP